MTPKKNEFWPKLKQVALSLGLPNVVETTSYRQPCLKAHKKLWVWCSPHADAFAFHLPIDEREFLIGAEPDQFFVTDHYLGHEIVLVYPDKFDSEWVKSNLKRVWRDRASKRFLEKFDAGTL